MGHALLVYYYIWAIHIQNVQLGKTVPCSTVLSYIILNPSSHMIIKKQATQVKLARAVRRYKTFLPNSLQCSCMPLPHLYTFNPSPSLRFHWHPTRSLLPPHYSSIFPSSSILVLHTHLITKYGNITNHRILQ